MTIEDHVIVIGASSGVALSTASDDDTRDLVRRADLSMLANERSSRVEE